MGLAFAIEHTVAQADRLDGAGQNDDAACRTMALRGEEGGDFGIALSFAGQTEQRSFHLRRACTIGEPTYGHRQSCGRRCAATPYHAYLNVVATTAAQAMKN